MTDTLDLDLIELRCEQASPGPWPAEHVHLAGIARMLTILPRTAALTSEDANFISRARQDMPTMVAEIRRLRAENEALTEGAADALTEAYNRGYNDGWDAGADRA